MPEVALKGSDNSFYLMRMITLAKFNGRLFKVTLNLLCQIVLNCPRKFRLPAAKQPMTINRAQDTNQLKLTQLNLISRSKFVGHFTKFFSKAKSNYLNSRKFYPTNMTKWEKF